MFGSHFTSNLTVVLPQNLNPSTPPSLRDYLALFYKQANKPLPPMTDGVERGILHPRNKVEILFVAMPYEMWGLFTQWMGTAVAEEVASSNRVRAYTDRITVSKVLYTEVINGTTYLALLSSPYDTKEHLQEFTKNLWGVPIPLLYTERKEPAVLPVKTFPPLPPRPNDFKPNN